MAGGGSNRSAYRLFISPSASTQKKPAESAPMKCLTALSSLGISCSLDSPRQQSWRMCTRWLACVTAISLAALFPDHSACREAVATIRSERTREPVHLQLSQILRFDHGLHLGE